MVYRNDITTAVLRVSSSLDLVTVLQEVVDSARALTGARYGLIVTADRAASVEEFVTSGLAAGEKERLADWPDGPRLFAHFRDLAGPLRIPDLPAYVRALGFSADLMQSKMLQAAPMRHRGALVGLFFLGEKREGLEFTGDDEEVLMLFTAQAASVIANARAHRGERRARADLETLIETSPAGVVVFDGTSGDFLSLNREARRIVKGLSMPGRSKEGLLALVTCRRTDGRGVALAEFPMAQLLSSAKTVRAEEMTLSVPDGRSVTTLVNASPIWSPNGSWSRSRTSPRSRKGRNGRPGPGRGRGRLHRQAVLPGGTRGARAGRTTPECRTGAVRARGTLDPLRPAAGRLGRPAPEAHAHRVRAAPCALPQRRTGAHARVAAAPGPGAGATTALPPTPSSCAPS